MRERTLDIATADGAMDTFIAHPDRDPHPAIILYMDGLGVRPTLHAMARRLAGLGYYVALPNLYHCFARAENLHLESDMNRMMELYASLDTDKVAQSTAAVLATLAGDAAARVTSVGSVGYCMGGSYALAMAGRFPDRFAATACIHGGAVATDAPGSPHRLAAQMRARLYIAVAEEDPFLQPGETARLRAALDEAGADYDMEIYAGAQHGFAVPGLGSYNESAAAKHWQRIEQLFKEVLVPAA